MIDKIRRTFALTEDGAKGIIKASLGSCLMYTAYMLPIILLMIFVQDALGDDLKGALVYVGIMAAIIAVMYVFINISYNTTYNETYKEAANLRISIATTLKGLPLSYFSRHDVSDLSQTVMQDVADVEHAMSHAIPEAIGFAIYFVLIAILMISANPTMGLSIIAPIAVSTILAIITRKIQVNATTKFFHKLRENSESFQEAIEMQQEIKSYGREDLVEHEMDNLVDEVERIHIRTEFAQAVTVNASASIIRFALGLSVIVGSYLYAAGEISLLYLVGYIIAATRIVDGISGLFLNIAEILYIDSRIKRIREISEVEVQEGKPCEIGKFDIEFSHVGFSYDGKQKVVDDISFVAKQDEVTALIGPSGCGKTTVLRLMSRLYDNDSGEILIDGKNIKEIDTDSLFEKISIVFQDVTLFNTTIMENIRLGNTDAGDDEVKRAAELANCDFIANLPDGYDTMIGENGMKLSGGERQRISIARAILKDAPIIILDEISASLDVENEMKIQNSLNHLIRGKTVVIISHRLKSIEKADKIIVMNSGKIESTGKHDELLKKSPTYSLMISRARMTEKYVY